MVVSSRQSRIFKTDTDEHGNPLTSTDRERLIKPYLPRQPSKTSSSQTSTTRSPRTSARFKHKPRVRPALRHILHTLIFNLIHIIFSIYIRLRQAKNALFNQILAVLYHHHRTPELIAKDFRGLEKVPGHLSVILQLGCTENGGRGQGGKGFGRDGLDNLMDEACEVVAWSACAGIPVLSIYEKTGK